MHLTIRATDAGLEACATLICQFRPQSHNLLAVKRLSLSVFNKSIVLLRLPIPPLHKSNTKPLNLICQQNFLHFINP